MSCGSSARGEHSQHIRGPCGKPPPLSYVEGGGKERVALASTAVGAETDVAAPIWRYIGPVPSIQVKDVPDAVHATLRRRAAAAGMSLQEYLLALLTEDAHTPTLDEVLDRAGGRAGGRSEERRVGKECRSRWSP